MDSSWKIHKNQRYQICRFKIINQLIEIAFDEKESRRNIF